MRSFFEIDKPRHVRLTTDASDYTRNVRLMAQAAPYIQSGKQVGAPRLGWKHPELATQSRIIAPLFGKLNTLYPNRR